MATEIRSYEIPLIDSLKPALNFSIQDIKDPSKRKSDFSKTITLPSSKVLDKLFNHIFEINTVTNTFNANKRLDVEYYADEELQIKGFLKLNEVITTDLNEVKYSVNIFGQLSDLFSDIEGLYLKDVQGLDTYDHDYTITNISQSWDSFIVEDGSPALFELGKGYVYPLIEYGFDSNLKEYDVEHLFPSIYVKEYVDRIFADSNFSYQSTFFDSVFFKSLIIPFNKSRMSLTNDQVNERTFSADGAAIELTGTPTTLVFPNEVDPNGVYNNATGEFTAANSGYYNAITTLDLEGVYTPSSGSGTVGLNKFINVTVGVYKNGVLEGSGNVFLGDEDVNIANNDSYSTGVSVAYPSDAHNTFIFINPISFSVTKVDNKLTNPASNLRISINDILVDAADVIDVKVSFDTITNIEGNSSFTDASGNGYSGSFQAFVRSGKFLNTITNSQLVQGSEIDMYSVVPSDIKQKDFLTSLFKMFNLQIEPSRTDDKILVIEPYNDFYTTNKTDFSQKRDISRELIQEPMGLLEASEYKYQYKQDKDKYNQDYEAEYNEIYGQRSGLIDNDFTKNVITTDLIFSPTPLVGQSDVDMIVPTIIKDDDTYKSTESNIRILYYGGLKTTSTAWILRTSLISGTQYTQYPYAGHLDDPKNPTLDINFGLTKRLYYNNSFDPIFATNNSLFNKYHLGALKQISNRDSKLISGWFYLTPKDIRNLTFRNVYYFDNSYFRLYSIENYDPNKPITKCKFTKLISVNPFEDGSLPLYGGDFSTGEVVDGVSNIEDAPFFGYDRNESNNNYSQKSGTVQGENNRVAESSLFVDIFGDGNYVAENSRKVKIINGNNNIVSNGVENVTLLNSDNLVITESNVTYVNGALVNEGIIRGGVVLEIDFGDTPVSSKEFTISDVNVSGTSSVIASLIYEVTDTKEIDEFEMDSLILTCGKVQDGRFIILAKSFDGSYLAGAFKIQYLVTT